MSLTVRPAAAADIPAITAIYGPAVLTGTASFEVDAPDEAEMLRRFEAITGAGYPYFVADLDGRVAGYAYASAYRTRPGYRFTVEDSVYVEAGRRGAGLGGLVLAELLRLAGERGHRSVMARIIAGNEASRRVHARLHFTLVGVERETAFKHGRWLDIMIVQRRL